MITMNFSDLSIGDVFNTISGRFVKTDDNEAMSIIDNGYYKLAEFIRLDNCYYTIVPLFVAIPPVLREQDND